MALADSARVLYLLVSRLLERRDAGFEPTATHLEDIEVANARVLVDLQRAARGAGHAAPIPDAREAVLALERQVTAQVLARVPELVQDELATAMKEPFMVRALRERHTVDLMERRS